jgi:glycosyltransferase involved in cell wall biosynthesis
MLFEDKYNPLVSIIMPAYNAELYLHEAIQSVIGQTYDNWQLLIINDGSKDNTEKIIQGYKDTRIIYFSQDNRGVSTARNVGLANMQGEFVCFLDADDVFPPDSLRDRVDIFKNNPDVDFADGRVYITGPSIRLVERTWTPAYRGCPQRELVRLRETCFVTASWMIRRKAIGDTRFKNGLSHAEDLLLFIELSPNRLYDYTESPTLYFRRTGKSAMSNLDGLANGYLGVFRILREKKLFPSSVDRYIYKAKMIKIMFLSYFFSGRPLNAFLFIIKNLFV